MNKAQKRFRLYAILVIFVLLTVLLAIINGVNFTMAAEDADELTQTLADRQGSFDRGQAVPGGRVIKSKERGFRMGPMGPDSPETDASLRYFTIAFSPEGQAVETVAYRVLVVTESEAQEWAASLLKEKTGWTRGTYRYRVYQRDKLTYVTVIDQGRELLASYRILIISAVGELLCLLIGWFALFRIGKRVYAPMEEADRKQRNFIRSANEQFRLPLTIIDGNTELMERKYGPDEETRSIRCQLNKLNELVDKLGAMGIFEDGDMHPAQVCVSEFLQAALDREKESFSTRGIELTANIAPDVQLSADPEAVKQMINELIGNALKFALSKASFELANENGYVRLETRNDADLPDGPADQAFDRFTVLNNADGQKAGAGLGLAYVKEVVKAHHGRVTAAVSGGVFTLCITI